MNKLDMPLNAIRCHPMTSWWSMKEFLETAGITIPSCAAPFIWLDDAVSAMRMGIEFGSYAEQLPCRRKSGARLRSHPARSWEAELHARRVALKAIGWGISHMTRNGQTVCTLEKNGRRFSSRSHSIRLPHWWTQPHSWRVC